MVACVCVSVCFLLLFRIFLSSFTSFVIRVLLLLHAERRCVPAQDDVCYYWSFCKRSKTYSSNKKNFIGQFWIRSFFPFRFPLFTLRPINFYLCNKMNLLCVFCLLQFEPFVISCHRCRWCRHLGHRCCHHHLCVYSVNADANYQRKIINPPN